MSRAITLGGDPKIHHASGVEHEREGKLTSTQSIEPGIDAIPVDIATARPSTSRGYVQGLIHSLVQRGAQPIDGVTIPNEMHTRLEKSAKDWQKHGAAAGPAFVNGDLARRRFVNKKDPHAASTLEWLTKGGAGTLTAHNVQAFLGADVCITPTRYDHGLIYVEDTHRGTLEKAEDRMGFVKFTLRLEDGSAFEVPFLGNLSATSYVGILHGHLIRETNDGAFRPAKDYRGLTVYARTLEGGTPPKVGAPAIGTVVDQDQSSITLRTARGELFRFEQAEGDLLQVLVVPSTSLKATGTNNWMAAFDSLEQLIGQELRIHFNPVSRASSVVGRITGVEREGEGVRLKFRTAEGLDMESTYTHPGHVVLSPSLEAHKLTKDAKDHPSYLGQYVDATLVNQHVTSSGYGSNWWVDEQIFDRVRGKVIAQEANQLVIAGVNGEVKTLDLAPLKADGPISGFHELKAAPYIWVHPLGLWAPKAS